MKKILCLLCLFAFVTLSSTALLSCNRKSGCPMNEKIVPKTNKQGVLKTPKRKKPKLF